MTDMQPGQSIDDAIGTPTEVVGRRAGPLMGVVSRVVSLGGAIVRGFNELMDGMGVAQEHLSAPIMRELIEAQYAPDPLGASAQEKKSVAPQTPKWFK